MKNMRKISYLVLALLQFFVASAEDSLKVVTWNIDTNIGRTEEGFAYASHPEWTANQRARLIRKELAKLEKTEHPDVMQIQEGRKFVNKFKEEVDSITPVVNALEALGYIAIVQGYNPTDRAFSYITALKKNKFTVDGQEQLYITQTPECPTDHTNHKERLQEIKDHNFGEEWERCVFNVYAHDKKTGQKYRFKNAHFGIGYKGRVEGSRLIVEDSQKLAQQDPEVLEVITGDFNTFPDWGGPEQMEIMTKDGLLTEATKDLYLPNDQIVDTSFIAFPFDFGAKEQAIAKRIKDETGKPLWQYMEEFEPKERKQEIERIYKCEANALGGKLDHVLYRGFKGAHSVLVPSAQYDDFDIDNFTEEGIKDDVLRHHNDGPAFASDHQPVVTEFIIEK